MKEIDAAPEQTKQVVENFDELKQEPEVWFCPDCGTISDTQTRCCPDWIRSRKVPENFAKTCKETFDRAIAPVKQEPGLQEPEEEIKEAAYNKLMDRLEDRHKRIAELEAEKDAWQGRYYAADGQREKYMALEAELMEQARVNGMGGEREAKLMAQNAQLLEALKKIATVNAMDYEYQEWASAAIAQVEGKKI